MRALVVDSDNKTANLVTDRPIPKLRDDYLLIKTKAVALNPTDWKHLEGKRARDGCVLGCDFSGVVEEIGPRVTKSWAKGDRVAGVAHGANFSNPEDGCFAGYVMAKGDVQIKLPDSLSFEQGATVSLGAFTCAQGLFQKALKLHLPDDPVKEKTFVLIYGGSTATGTLAVQYAHLAGYTVLTTCSPRNFDLLKSLGAAETFDYNETNVGARIREYTSNNLKFAWDCSGSDNGPQICADALSSNPDGLRYGNIVGKKCPREDVPSVTTMMYTIFGEEYQKAGSTTPASKEDFEFAKKFAALTEKLLNEGKLKTHQEDVRPGGLEGVVHGLNDLKEGKVSGKKLVYRVEETHAHDHAILEAAYQTNSKPDKNERAEIVRKVQLGEKEVQIWFQNRRQNDRRRSKPLMPHELLAHFHNYVPSLPTPSQSFDASNQSGVVPPGSDPAQQSSPSSQPSDPAPAVITSSRPLNLQDLLDPATPEETAPTGSDQSASRSVETLPDRTPPPSFEIAPVQSSSPKDDTQETVVAVTSQEAEETPGSGKKRAYDEMKGDTADKTAENNIPDTVKSTREPLKRTSSVRLSMTVDGAVKIRTNDEVTPSPPKKRTTPAPSISRSSTGITRSKSAVDAVDMFKDTSRPTTSRQPGAGFGRSRDARTWEFFCDSSARDALATQAAAEIAGSAVSAINLIRSNSHKSRPQVLSPSLTKTNVQPNGARRKSEKPKLARARSSLARLQGVVTNDKPQYPEKLNSSQPVHSPSGDSDKENWAPGTRNSDNSMRRTQTTSSRRPVLQDNPDHIFRDARREGNRSVDDANSSPAIMGVKEKAGGEDLDCVQSLLSLSQGAWR